MIAITLLLIRFQAYLTAVLNEIECALVIQMACTHSGAMAVLSRLRGEPPGTELLLGWRPRRHACCAPTQPRSKLKRVNCGQARGFWDWSW